MPRKLPGMYLRNGWWHSRWPYRGSLGSQDYTTAAAEHRRRCAELEVSRGTRTEEVRQDPTISDEVERYIRDVLPIRRCPKAARDAALRLRRGTHPVHDLRPGSFAVWSDKVRQGQTNNSGFSGGARHKSRHTGGAR